MTILPTSISKGNFWNISVITVYAPALNVSDRDRDKFYRELQLTISLPKSDLIGGDWNARADSRCRHLMVGKYGTAVRYDPICSSFCRA